MSRSIGLDIPSVSLHSRVVALYGDRHNKVFYKMTCATSVNSMLWH